MEKKNENTAPDVESVFGASIQPKLFPPGTLRIPPQSCNKNIDPPHSMLAPYKIESNFPDATELINEFIKTSEEFKVGESEDPNG